MAKQQITTSQIKGFDEILGNKQDKLTVGENISIDSNNVISVSMNEIWYSSTSATTNSINIDNLAINSQLFLDNIELDGTYVFTYDGAKWLDFNNEEINTDDYGIFYDGNPVSGDTISVTIDSIEGSTLSTGLTNIKSVSKNGLELRPWSEYRINNGDIYFVEGLLITDVIKVVY